MPSQPFRPGSCNWQALVSGVLHVDVLHDVGLEFIGRGASGTSFEDVLAQAGLDSIRAEWAIQAVEIAKKYLGVDYRGVAPTRRTGLDCSASPSWCTNSGSEPAQGQRRPGPIRYRGQLPWPMRSRATCCSSARRYITSGSTWGGGKMIDAPHTGSE